MTNHTLQPPAPSPQRAASSWGPPRLSLLPWGGFTSVHKQKPHSEAFGRLLQECVWPCRAGGGGWGSWEMPGDGLRLTTSLFQKAISTAARGSEGNSFLMSSVRRLERPGSLADSSPQNCQTLNPLTGLVSGESPACQQKLLPWSPHAVFTSPEFTSTQLPSPPPNTHTHTHTPLALCQKERKRFLTPSGGHPSSGLRHTAAKAPRESCGRLPAPWPRGPAIPPPNGPAWSSSALGSAPPAPPPAPAAGRLPAAPAPARAPASQNPLPTALRSPGLRRSRALSALRGT